MLHRIPLPTAARASSDQRRGGASAQGRRAPRRGLHGHRLARRSTRPSASTPRHAAPGARRGRASCATCRTARRARCAAAAARWSARWCRRSITRSTRARRARMQAVLDARATRWCWPSTTTTSAAELRVTEQLVRHGVDAFVFVGLHHDPALFALLESYGRPYVLTWGVDPMRRHPSIGFDNRAATFEITRHLIALGHRALRVAERVDRRQRSRHGTRRRHARGARAGRTGARRALRRGTAPIDLAAARAMMRDLLALRRAADGGGRRPTTCSPSAG